MIPDGLVGSITCLHVHSKTQCPSPCLDSKLRKGALAARAFTRRCACCDWRRLTQPPGFYFESFKRATLPGGYQMLIKYKQFGLPACGAVFQLAAAQVVCNICVEWWARPQPLRRRNKNGPTETCCTAKAPSPPMVSTGKTTDLQRGRNFDDDSQDVRHGVTYTLDPCPDPGPCAGRTCFHFKAPAPLGRYKGRNDPLSTRNAKEVGIRDF